MHILDRFFNGMVYGQYSGSQASRNGSHPQFQELLSGLFREKKSRLRSAVEAEFFLLTALFIELIDLQKSETKAQACDNACVC